RLLRRHRRRRAGRALPRPAIRAAARHRPVPHRVPDRHPGLGAGPRPAGDAAGPSAALPRGRRRSRAPARAGPAPGNMSARHRELLGLVPASLLLTAGFAAVYVAQEDVLSDVSLTYGAIFLGLCVGAHLIIRFTLPSADPYLFPLAATLACFGLVMIYRIDAEL